MAQLIVEGDDVVVKLRPVEKFWSFHADVRIPRRAIRRIRTPSDPWTTMRGWRSTGVSIPGYVAMGKRRHGAGYDFTVVFRHRPTVVLECNGGQFGEVTVSVDDAFATAARLADAAGIIFDPAP
jgi:hypothetical protein